MENEKDVNAENQENLSENELATPQPEQTIHEANISQEESIKANNPHTQALEKSLAEQKDNYLRLYADFENFKRRTAKEKIDFLEQANSKLLADVLPVFDDFERALKSFENPELKIETAKEGMMLIHQKFAKFLEKQGLKVMETHHQAFDPDKHEAITQVPVTEEELKGKIIDTIEKGYFLGEKVIRFAKVVIGN